MIVRALLVPLLAIAGLAFAGWTISTQAKPIPASIKVAEPAQTALPTSVSGSGIVESASENIAIGSPLGGIVVEVPIAVGSQVQKNAVLFRLDDRSLMAQLAVQQTQLTVATAQLERLRQLPRAEDLAPALARLSTARSTAADAEAAYKLYDGLTTPGVISVDDSDRRRFTVEKARAQVAEAEAAVSQISAGAWSADIAVQQAQIASLAAQCDATRTEINRMIIRAPFDGTVLQVRIHPGEFAPANSGTSLVLLGDTNTLNIRADFDENDAWRLKPDAHAEAYVRGNRALTTTLKLVRIEPFVIPKKNLTNDATERVDTRVIQVVYAVEKRDLALHVGQLMDVFVEAP